MEFNFEDNEETSEMDLNSPVFSEIFQVHDAIIFLVDIKALYFINENFSDNNMEIVLKAYKGLLKNKIISSSHNKCGLVFYNTVNKKNPLHCEGVYIFHELGSILPSHIKDADLIKDILKEEVGVAEEEALFNEALWVCNNQFQNNCDAKNSFQRIFIFTTNDFPNKNLPNSKNEIKDYLNVI